MKTSSRQKQVSILAIFAILITVGTLFFSRSFSLNWEKNHNVTEYAGKLNEQILSCNNALLIHLNKEISSGQSDFDRLIETVYLTDSLITQAIPPEMTAHTEIISTAYYDYKLAMDKILGSQNSIALNESFDTFYTASNKLTQLTKEIRSEANTFYADDFKTLKQQLFAFTALFILAGIGLLLSAFKNINRTFARFSLKLKKLLDNRAEKTTLKDFKYLTPDTVSLYEQYRATVSRIAADNQNRETLKNKNRELHKKYRELTDQNPQAVFESDNHGKITYVNKAWCTLFDTKTNEPCGLTVHDTLQPASDDQCILGLSPLHNADFIAVSVKGKEFSVSVFTSNIVDNNKLIGRRGIVVDKRTGSELVKRLEKDKQQAEQTDRLKSSFLANMSHEIRTPMNTIIGFSDLLESPELSESQKIEFVNHIKSSGEMLLHLIDDIIDIAKIEAGEIKINKQDTDVGKMLGELEKTFAGYKKQLEKDTVELKVQIPEEKTLIITDPFRLKQIMHNLLSNAIKFTDNGAVTFGCRTEKGQISFFVHDTGIGLTPDKLNHIFRRFQQVKPEKNLKITGSGLGLAISKNLVELLGGDMKVSSKPAEGTKFSFSLPLVKIRKNNTPQANCDKPKKTECVDWSGKSVLVAEDIDINYSFLKEALIPTGIEILRACDGNEAVEMALKHPFDLVLMDIKMPELDGYEATGKIKAVKKTLPVIALTANAMADERQKSIYAGCDDYLPKPFRVNVLFAKMAQFLPSRIIPVHAETGNSRSQRKTGFFKNQPR